MAIKKQKFELTWIDKEERSCLEPRILLEDQELSYHAKHRVSEKDCFENRLIFGDNLLALKAWEQDFIYITTASLTHEQLQELADEVGPDRSLLVLCTAFRGNGDYANLIVKKIPRQVLARCEWGHDDYSLKVENLSQKPPEPGQLSLFDMEGES